MPKYLEIEKILKERIKDGTYPSGSMIPRQDELAEEFNTSRITIRKALDYLINVGLVYTQRGSGTFVRSNAQEVAKFSTDIDQYVGTTQQLGKNYFITSKVIYFKIRYPKREELDALNLDDRDLVYDIKRLRLLDGHPYAFEYTIMPVKVIPGIDNSVLEKSIYMYIEKELAQKIGSAYRKINAAKPNDDDKKYLECKSDDPVLVVRQVVSLANDTPFEFSETHHRYDREGVMIYLPGKNK